MVVYKDLQSRGLILVVTKFKTSFSKAVKIDI